MTTTEENKKDRAPERAKKNKEELPWWVELLFVQIGLPEKLLVNLLKFNNDTRNRIKMDCKKYIYILLALIALIYIDPIIKQARFKNKCIENTAEYIEKNTNIKDLNKLTIQSINFCNGGEISDDL